MDFNREGMFRSDPDAVALDKISEEVRTSIRVAFTPFVEQAIKDHGCKVAFTAVAAGIAQSLGDFFATFEVVALKETDPESFAASGDDRVLPVSSAVKDSVLTCTMLMLEKY